MHVMSNQIRIVGIAGSLRKGSYNRSLLNAAGSLLPEGATLEIAEIGDLPLFNSDVLDAGLPDSVNTLGQVIAGADAVLIVTPEYNYSVPGVLKNAIDWVSRHPSQPLQGKPVAIMGASMGNLGTARAQYHLRQILVFLDAHPINKPEVMVGGAHTKFDGEGTLNDDATAEFVRKLLESLVAWAVRLGSA
jgi:chromate reductase, NAD(P)H dehydrogenase (quinone)